MANDRRKVPVARAQRVFLVVCGLIVAYFIITVVLNNRPSGSNPHNDDQAIIAAAQVGVCQRVGRPCDDEALAGWRKTLNGYEPSIVRADSNHAVVSFFFERQNMAEQSVARDENGQWHAE